MSSSSTAICTLFEGSYHYGVAVLANSLYRNGFKGSFYAGYRGELPHWATSVTLQDMGWGNGKTFKVKDDFSIHFIPLATDYHLTNYKPDFMLDLWNGPAAAAERMLYFDPDINLIVPFAYIEEWIDCGVGVCEDINSPIEQFNPRRVGWRDYYSKYNVALHFKNSIYCNGGFAGVSKRDKAFLETWKHLQELMALTIGGLNKSSFKNAEQIENSGRYKYYFGKTDQDALNAAVEAYEGTISYMGKEAMDFTLGVPLMPHALGGDKPWLVKPFSFLLKGIKPRIADKKFWEYADGPVKAYPGNKVSTMNFQIKIWSFLNRFYSK